MSEVFVFKVGPFQLAHGPHSMFFMFGSDLAPFLAGDDESALRQIAEHERGAVLTCEPKLRDAGTKLGYAARPFSRLMAYRCAIASLKLAVAPSLEEIDDLDVTDAFCDAAHAFAFADVLRVFPANAGYVVDVSGSVHRRYESMLQDTSTGVYGFVLYEEPGALQKLSGPLGPEGQTVMDSLSLFLLKEPVFVAEAMQRAYGLDGLPCPGSVKQGVRANLTDHEVLTISAAALAFADMATRRSDLGRAIVDVGNVTVQAEITPLWVQM